MLLDTPLRMQGIVKGNTLTLLVRHAKIHDPYDVQHFVAYREEDTIQYFLAALRETSSIPTLSEIIICHKGLCLDPANRFKDCLRTVKSRVRLSGNMIFRLRLHQYPESLRMMFARHGMTSGLPRSSQ